MPPTVHGLPIALVVIIPTKPLLAFTSAIGRKEDIRRGEYDGRRRIVKVGFGDFVTPH